MWYRKLMPVKKLSWRNVVLAGLCLGRLQSWFVKWRQMWSQQTYACTEWCAWEWIYKLYSCQAWCLTTSEWVNNHYYFVSFEHSVSLQVLHSHSNRPRLKSLGEIRSLGGNFPPKMCLDKTLSIEKLFLIALLRNNYLSPKCIGD